MVPRLALCCALIGLVANAASFVGLSLRPPFEFLALVHIAIVVLGFVLFIRLIQVKYWAVRAGAIEMPPFDVPRWVVWGAAFGLAYMLWMFFRMFAVYGEGYPQLRNGQEVWIVRDAVVRVVPAGSISTYDAWELRIFSAGWMAFGLGITAIYHHAEVRIRTYREALASDDDRSPPNAALMLTGYRGVASYSVERSHYYFSRRSCASGLCLSELR